MKDFNATLAGMLLDPRRTAKEVARPERLLEGVLVYLASIAAAVLFYANLPAELPAQFSEFFPFLTQGPKPVSFWIAAAAWGTALFLAEAGALRVISRGLGAKTTLLAIVGLFCWIHVYYLLMFVAMQGAVWARSAQAAYLFELVFTLWSLYAGVMGLKELSGLSVPKAFAAVVLASLAALFVLFGAHQAGLIGPEHLKALVMF